MSTIVPGDSVPPGDSLCPGRHYSDSIRGFPVTQVSKLFLLAVLLFVLAPIAVFAAEPTSLLETEAMPWWGWAALLFVFTLALGVIAALGGVGGGVLFVPIVSSIFPFHLDFVRGAGLMVALCGALSAGPTFLTRRLASLRLAIPLALVGSVGSIAGAMVGLALPVNVVQIALGVAIVSIVLFMVRAAGDSAETVRRPDALSAALSINGLYLDERSGEEVRWDVHRMPLGIVLFVGIGFLAGMFGIGAGWANVPALNLLLGAPLKVSVATSGLILSINDTAAGWIYLNRGAVLPLIAVPSVAGMMIGTRIGARLLGKTRPAFVRWLVISILFLAGIRSILSGTGVM